MENLQLFFRDESGALTIEWVALGAGVMLLAMGVVVIIDEAMTSPTEGIAQDLNSAAEAFLDLAAEDLGTLD